MHHHVYAKIIIHEQGLSFMHEHSNPLTIENRRHSCAHIMAAAIQKLWPNAKFGVGPVIDNGFYYDFVLDEHLGEADLERITSMMRKLKKKKSRFTRQEKNIDEAISFMQNTDQPFKVELLELLKTKGSTAIEKAVEDKQALGLSTTSQGTETISFYQTGDFIDLCRGPHVEHSGQIGSFKLHKISGAYWRGHEKNPQMQRIYGLCFENDTELEAEILRLEQLKARDHRKLGKQLGIYTNDDTVGRGLPLWLPNGVVIRKELEKIAQAYERIDGYQEVSTPHLAKSALYYQSGHLPYYKEDMYNPIEIDEETYYLKPMNCPHHHKIFQSDLHSYRDLPLRYTEWGQVYRYEKSGALSGLMRARGFCMNDAHIYCRYDQVAEEIEAVLKLHARYYELFDIKDFSMVLCLPDSENTDKYSDDQDNWNKTAEIIRSVMTKLNYPFVEEEGEAAFYGPKIDFIIKSALGTAYTISTCQLDFLAPQRFDLNYRTETGEQAPVLVIHRAPLGTHERFIAFLLEHYGGQFPTWLAPVQVTIIPIADRHIAYAQSVYKQLFKADVPTATGGLRVSIDTSSERMQKKIRNAQLKKIPYQLILGDQEQADNTVAVRHNNQTTTYSLDVFLESISKEITSKASHSFLQETT